MSKIKIAISGKANSGKDTLANNLIKELGIEGNCCKIAFADTLKKIIAETYESAVSDCLWGPSQKRSEDINGVIKKTFKNGYLEENNLTYRDALIDLGKFGRYYDEDIWVLSTIFDAEDSGKHIVLSDLRFKNELNHLKNENYILIRLIRTNNKSNIDDISEKDLDDVPDSNFDYVIVNDSNIESFYDKIKQLSSEIKSRYQL